MALLARLTAPLWAEAMPGLSPGGRDAGSVPGVCHPGQQYLAVGRRRQPRVGTEERAGCGRWSGSATTCPTGCGRPPGSCSDRGSRRSRPRAASIHTTVSSPRASSATATPPISPSLLRHSVRLHRPGRRRRPNATFTATRVRTSPTWLSLAQANAASPRASLASATRPNPVVERLTVRGADHAASAAGAPIASATRTARAPKTRVPIMIDALRPMPISFQRTTLRSTLGSDERQLIRANPLPTQQFLRSQEEIARATEEKGSGTLEMLITMPVRDWQVMVGKFLAGMAMLAAMVGLTCSTRSPSCWSGRSTRGRPSAGTWASC